jgi:glycosyltransferase involved in cell wall biosynthesis
MRIVFLTYVNNPSYRSAESWLARISGALAIMEHMARSVSVTNIHSIGHTGTLKRAGVDYVFVKCNRLQLLFPFTLHRFVARLNPDAVIVRGLIFPLQVLMLRWQLGSKSRIVAQHHAEMPLKGYKGLLQKRADKIIAAYFFCSRELAQPWIASRQIASSEKVFEALVIPSSFSSIDPSLARQKTGVVGEAYLWIGDLDSNKDPLTLIMAFNKFTNGNSDKKLYIIFNGDELLPVIKEMIDPKTTTLVGRVEHDDMLYWCNSCDFIISTSLRESIGAAVCEGIACGCIPILTDIPSFRWITGQGEIGLLFPAGNVQALHDALNATTRFGAAEREKVLSKHKSHLSAAANSARVISSIKSLHR